LLELIVDDRTGDLHIVDWDTLVFAPKERDLMFIGGGFSDGGYTSAQEAEMFFGGYGQTAIDRNAITYYRCARIIEDLVIYCRQIFLSGRGRRSKASGRICPIRFPAEWYNRNGYWVALIFIFLIVVCIYTNSPAGIASKASLSTTCWI